MFCKNCGNPINPNAIACLSCGCDPRKGKSHCGGCGTKINEAQIICIQCGASLNNGHSSTDDGKTVAIVSYITLIGFIIAVVQHSTSKTKLGAYHLRQSLGFMITGVALAILLFIIEVPAYSMGYLSALNYLFFIEMLSFFTWIGLLICVIISLVNAINGVEKPAPIFGKLYEQWFAGVFE
jgi:hypothetical protein